MTLVKAGDGIVDMRGQLGGVYFHRDKSGLHSSSMPRKVRRRSAAQCIQRKAFIAARTLSKDNRTVSYLMYRYMNGLPIGDGAVVTGDPVPDCTGNYRLSGTHNGENYYEISGSTYFVWYHLPLDIWVISDGLDVLGLIRWQHASVVEGTYTPIAMATGNPVCKLEINTAPFDYQIPKL